MEKEVIRVWFCNRRQKEKRINPCSAAPMLPSPGKPASYSPHMVPRARLGGGRPQNSAGTCVKPTLPGCPQSLEQRQGESLLGTGHHVDGHSHTGAVSRELWFYLGDTSTPRYTPT